jgi:hypothetical protein
MMAAKKEATKRIASGIAATGSGLSLAAAGSASSAQASGVEARMNGAKLIID